MAPVFRIRNYRFAIASIAVVALLVGVGGISLANHLSDGMIHACVKPKLNNSGVVIGQYINRLVDDPSKCTLRHESPLDWNSIGPQGPSGVVQTAALSGLVGDISSNGSFIFAGPTAVVTTTASQRLTASVSAALGMSAGGPTEIYIAMCYAPSGGPPGLTLFQSFLDVEIGTQRGTESVSQSTVPGAGTWVVGFCAENFSGVTVDDNKIVSGWVQVTN